MNLRGIPDDVHRAFKVLCTIRGISMTEAIIRLMRTVVTNNAEGQDEIGLYVAEHGAEMSGDCAPVTDDEVMAVKQAMAKGLKEMKGK